MEISKGQHIINDDITTEEHTMCNMMDDDCLDTLQNQFYLSTNYALEKNKIYGNNTCTFTTISVVS